MANLDSTVTGILDRATATSDVDEDSLIDELEQDSSPHLAALRERRVQELKLQLSRANELRAAGAGTYQDMADEKGVINATTSNRLCIVHFYKSDFNRCRIMDGHLEVSAGCRLPSHCQFYIHLLTPSSFLQTLASTHLDARFLRINVDRAPFLVTKLKVQVLPCVLGFVDGICKDRIVGFQGLGRGTDAFTTRQLEARLVQANILQRHKLPEGDGVGLRDKKPDRRIESEEEDDWD